ncbi:MAG: class A beta-lactamase-related serine hydrolase [Acidimicrobiia bacterium]|nr:class A beta-lactamase-related serine hydrolase [Acidimicrobiia bacterium]
MTSMADIVAPLAQRSIDECRTPAMAWGVVVDGSLATAGSQGEGIDENTPFRIASMTKSFTAAAVLGLRDEGVLSLDHPVADYVPELASVRGPDDSAPITLRHLLSMSAGMATDDAWADRHLDASITFMNDVYNSGVRFAVKPGEAFEYSNLGFAMIGRVVHNVTGRRVRDHVDERLLRPLGMSNTTWDEPNTPSARPHRVHDGRTIHDGPEPLGDGEISPMGGLWSTVADLARWVAWLDEANAGRDSGTGDLRASSRREMQTMNTYLGASTLDGVAAPSGYGFGLLVRDDATLGMVAGHSGGLPGYGSNMRWKKGSGVGVIGLANVTYAPMTVFTHRALSALHGAGFVPATSMQLASELRQRCERLVALLNSWNDDAARELFADNVVLDDAFEYRADEAARHLAGGRMEVTAIRPVNRTSGFIDVTVGSRRAVIEIALSPLGGLVQEYSWKDL